LAVVSVSGRLGTIDRQGNFDINPGQYDIVWRDSILQVVKSDQGMGLISRDGKWVVEPSKALSGIGAIVGKVFYATINGFYVPISMQGKLLAGPYQGAMVSSVVQDIDDENSALQSMRSLTSAEARYSASYTLQGFAASLGKLGPSTGAVDEDHAGLIDAGLAN